MVYVVTIVIVAAVSGLIGGLLGPYLVLARVASRMNKEAKKWDDLVVKIDIPNGGFVVR